jgi:hypothetical protein
VFITDRGDEFTPKGKTRMSRNIKNSSSGKTTLTAIATLFVALVGGIVFLRPAVAQGSGSSAKPVQFAPVTITASNVERNGATSVVLNCLLPAVTLYVPDSKDFRVVCSTPDGDLAYSLESTVNAPTFCQIQVSVIYNPEGYSTLQLVDLNSGKTKSLAISYSTEQVAIRLEPSTDLVGNQHEPTSADLQIQGQNYGGSNNPTPYTTIQQPYSK